MSKPNKIYVGRIAPSPTGFLHLGHAQTFKIAQERAQNGILLFRNEDLDFQRCREQYSQAMEEDLKLIGISWQDPIVKQSQRLPLYENAWKTLQASGLIYPCKHSRKTLENTSIFPKNLRNPSNNDPSPGYQNWRFKVPDGHIIRFHDNRTGNHAFEAGKDFGDFLVWRKIGIPSYELAVVVDDAAMNITEVVRGEDLLLSTARQLLLYQALNLTPPEFYHCPLVCDANGQRLAKQYDSLSIRELCKIT